MNLLLSAVAIAFGSFAAVSPTRAAAIWGWHTLHRLADPQRKLYLGWYRAFGVLLCLGGIFYALDIGWR